MNLARASGGASLGHDADSLQALPFDQYQRYRVVARAVERLRAGRKTPLKVLDVGGHAYTADGSGSLLPVRLFLPEEETVVLDVQAYYAPGYVRGSGAALPFAAGSFDVVVTCDTLEHVPPGERRGFLTELLRASRDYVVLIAPFYQQETLLADRILDLYITRTLGVIHRALREHLQAELPRCEEVRGWLEEAGLAYVDFPSGYVYHWLLMMMVKHYLLSFPDTLEMQRALDVFYNQHLADADERAPAYRHVFVVSKHGRKESLLEIRKDHDELSRARAGGASAHGASLLALLLNFIQLQRETGEERDLREKAISDDLRISDLEAQAAARDSQIADLSRILNEYHEHLTASHAKLQHAEAKLAEYVEALEEAKERLETYHESLTACMRNLEQTTETLDRFKKGRVVSAMMKAQELVRKIRGPLGV